MRNILLLTILLSFSSLADVPPDAAKVSWSSPVMREDNTALPSDQIKGYEVYWGRSPGDMTNVQFVQSPTTEHMVTELDEGLWYFAVKTVDTGDRKSVFSAFAIKTIQPDDTPPPFVPPQDPERINIR